MSSKSNDNVITLLNKSYLSKTWNSRRLRCIGYGWTRWTSTCPVGKVIVIKGTRCISRGFGAYHLLDTVIKLGPDSRLSTQRRRSRGWPQFACQIRTRGFWIDHLIVVRIVRGVGRDLHFIKGRDRVLGEIGIEGFIGVIFFVWISAWSIRITISRMSGRSCRDRRSAFFQLLNKE